MSGPEETEGSEPGVDGLKGLGPEAINAALRVDGGFDETGVPEHAQVPGDGGLRQAQAALNLTDGLPGRGEEAQDSAAIRFGDDLEDGIHFLYIRHGIYTCQGK